MKLTVFAALAATVALTVPAGANDLPNDCAITATEAIARLQTSAPWSQVLLVKLIDIKNFQASAHVVVAWQMHKDGAILVYDASGTIPLDTHSQKANDIAAAINALNPTQLIFEARFIQ